MIQTIFGHLKKGQLSGVQRSLLMIFTIFALCVLVEPAYIAATSESIHRMYRVLKIGVALITAFLFFIARIKMDGIIIGIILFEVELLLSTAVSGELYAWFQDGAYVIVLILLMQSVAYICPTVLFNALSVVLGSYVHINTICWLTFPQGMYRHAHGYWNCWFLGYDNIAVPIILLATFCAVYSITMHRNKWLLWDISVLVSGLSFIFIQKIATGIVSIIFFILMFLFALNKSFRNFIGKNKYIFVVMIISLFFFIQFIGINGEFLKQILASLGKNNTFSGRTNVWRIAWNDLMNKGLFWGRGVISGAAYSRRFGLIWVTHLHCYYLQVIYEGGAVSFAIMVFLIFHGLSRYDKTLKKVSSIIFLLGLVTYMLAWQVEAYDAITRYFVIALSLVYNTPVFEKDFSIYKPRKKICFILGKQIRKRK